MSRSSQYSLRLSALALHAAVVCSLAQVSLLAGCEDNSEVAPLSVDQRAAAVPSQADEFAKLGYRVEWRGFPTLTPGATLTQMDILGDAIGTLDSNGAFTLLDTRGGQARWADRPAEPFARFLGATREAGTVFLCTETEIFVFDAATGTLQAKHKMPFVANTHPEHAESMLIFGATDGRLTGILEGNGLSLWTSGVRGQLEHAPVRFGQSSALAFASGQGEVLVFDARTGHGYGRGKMFLGPGADLACSENAVFIASLDHSLYAFAKDDARLLWQYRTNAALRSAPTHHDGKVYVDLGEEGFSAIDAVTGKKLWSNKAVKGEGVALRKGRLIVFDGTTARLLDIAKGTIIESVEIRNISAIRADGFVDGPLYTMSPAGVVAKLSTR